ncbi:DUF4262 domain-containing protein [Pseudonocardiaceae bacterium YIM PH 21723]|nr:DUF4262 domain-containing protein [Pseudonocardiaceae bacterium YIM PH 21723]
MVRVELTEQDADFREWILRTADEHGAAVINVAADERGPQYSFTVGAWRRFSAPEAVVIGLPTEVAGSVLNSYVRRAAAGERFHPGQLYPGLLDNCSMTVEKVCHDAYPMYFGSAFLLYPQGNFPAIQLIMPIPDGPFPWQPDAPEGFFEFQPLLTDSGYPESWVPGRTGP